MGKTGIINELTNRLAVSSKKQWGTPPKGGGL